MKKPLLLGVVCASMFSLPVNAATILDTASGPDNGGSSTLLLDTNWLLHRFELTTATTITSIGGLINNTSGSDLTIFAALVELSGSTDLPDTIDLTSSDVLSTTLINIGTTSDLYQVATNITLDPGWYALEFGTNAFGASSVTDQSLTMPRLQNDLAPTQNPIIAFQVGHSVFPNSFSDLYVNNRFVIEGTVVPVPAAIWLFGTGLLGLVGIARRKKAA